jgi:hypothetical protein
MSRLSKQSIRKLCEGIDPLIVPFRDRLSILPT